MVSAKLLRRQAATCAALARQTHDDEGRQRYLQLEQTYLQLAEAEDQLACRESALAVENEIKPAA
jgi:hypothetical protein